MQIRGVAVDDGTVAVDPATELVFSSGSLTDLGHGRVQVAGGGGSHPGAARVLGPFPFAFDDAGLADGIALYTPTVGDVLLNAWIEIDIAWDGTTPKVDIGQGDANGMFGNSNPQNASLADDTAGAGSGSNFLSNTNQAALALWDLADSAGSYNSRLVPGKFLTTNPMYVWVSQDGSRGGADPGASQGSGAVYLVVATPSLS